MSCAGGLAVVPLAELLCCSPRVSRLVLPVEALLALLRDVQEVRIEDFLPGPENLAVQIARVEQLEDGLGSTADELVRYPFGLTSRVFHDFHPGAGAF